MNITLYPNFTKKRNSTLKPQAGSGLTLTDCVLKEPSDFLNPVIIMTPSAVASANSTPLYNYAWLPDFRRYYFIDNWTYNRGLWEAALSVDVMASFKESIAGMSCYVERAESAYDGNITDAAFPATTDFSIVHANLADSWYGVAPSGGCYVVGVINYQSSEHVGAVAYYAMTSANMNSFLNYLFGNSIFNASGITEISEGLFKSLFNPAQYIVSCVWFPFTTYAFGTTQTTVKLGYWDTNVTAIMVSNLAEQTFVTGQFPYHPQAASRGAFLNYAPYAYYTIYVPPFGTMPIDSSYRSYGNYVRCQVYIDHITGQATMRAGISQTSEGGTVSIWAGEASAMFGVPIQLAQVMSDYAGGIGKSLSSGNIIGGILSGLVSTATAAFSPTVTSIGANGSFINCVAAPGLIAAFANISGASDSIIGRPLMQQRTISTLSGYIKCRDVRANVPCLGPEKTMIESIMTGGFYYE